MSKTLRDAVGGHVARFIESNDGIVWSSQKGKKFVKKGFAKQARRESARIEREAVQAYYDDIGFDMTEAMEMDYFDQNYEMFWEEDRDTWDDWIDPYDDGYDYYMTDDVSYDLDPLYGDLRYDGSAYVPERLSPDEPVEVTEGGLRNMLCNRIRYATVEEMIPMANAFGWRAEELPGGKALIDEYFVKSWKT